MAAEQVARFEVAGLGPALALNVKGMFDGRADHPPANPNIHNGANPLEHFLHPPRLDRGLRVVLGAERSMSPKGKGGLLPFNKSFWPYIPCIWVNNRLAFNRH
jgi:hypothetical protein